MSLGLQVSERASRASSSEMIARMGVLSSPTKNVRDYYRKSFGSFNKVVTLKNHTFLALDAPGLVDEDYQRNTRGVSFDDWEPVSGGAVEAVRRIADRKCFACLFAAEDEKLDELCLIL